MTLDRFDHIDHVGVDVEPYGDTYPGEFVQADASRPPLEPGPDLLWLSPPCLRYCRLNKLNAERWEWEDGEIEERYPAFDDLRVRAVIEELDPDHYIIENIPDCPHLRDPVKLNGHAFGKPFEYERHFETSFSAPDCKHPGSPEITMGDGYRRDEWAEAKEIPREWPEQSVNGAIPRVYVEYLLNYCPSVPGVPVPEELDGRYSLLTEHMDI